MMNEPTHGKRKTPAQRAKLAQLLSNDTPVGEALVASGWSPTQALKGWDAVPDAVLAKLPKKAKRLMALGKIHKMRGGIWCAGAWFQTLSAGRMAAQCQRKFWAATPS